MSVWRLYDVLLFWQQSDVSDDSERFVSLKGYLRPKMVLGMLAGILDVLAFAIYSPFFTANFVEKFMSIV